MGDPKPQPFVGNDWYPLRVVVKVHDVGLAGADVKLDGRTIGQTGSDGVFPVNRDRIHVIPIGRSNKFVVQVYKDHYGPPPSTPNTPVVTWTWNAGCQQTELKRASEIRNTKTPGDIVNIVNVNLVLESPLLTFQVNHVSRPLQSATVEVRLNGPQGSVVASGSTNVAGEYKVRVVAGYYYYVVKKDGYVSIYGGAQWVETGTVSLEGGDMTFVVPLVPQGTPQVPRPPPRTSESVAIWAHGSHVPEGCGGGDGYVDVTVPDSGVGDQSFQIACVLSDLANFVRLLQNTSVNLPSGKPLAKHQIKRLALVAHGEAGRIDVDQKCSSAAYGGVPVDVNTSLTVDRLNVYQNDLLSIGEYFCADAAVLLASCEAGNGTAGEVLLIELSKLWPTVRVIGLRSRGSLNTTSRPNAGGLRYPGARDTGRVTATPGDLVLTRPWMSEISPSTTIARDGNIIRRGKPPTA